LKQKVLYQTLEDRGNPDEVELNCPYPCHRDNAWLGAGYYFWDTFIENAHWWGQVGYRNKYMICQFTCDFDTNNCFDLVGETEHMLDFSEAIYFLKSKDLINSDTTVARVLNFLKEKTNGFNYEAIRVYGIKSISENKEEFQKYRHRLIFEPSKHQFLDYKPAIQICIYKKTGLNLRNSKIEYPDEYNRDFLI
jgi:hypothetical protein